MANALRIMISPDPLSTALDRIYSPALDLNRYGIETTASSVTTHCPSRKGKITYQDTRRPKPVTAYILTFHSLLWSRIHLRLAQKTKTKKRPKRIPPDNSGLHMRRRKTSINISSVL